MLIRTTKSRVKAAIARGNSKQIVDYHVRRFQNRVIIRKLTVGANVALRIAVCRIVDHVLGSDCSDTPGEDIRADAETASEQTQ